MAEFPELGKHCNKCKQLDFLPIHCGECKSFYCKDHALNHGCLDAMVQAQNEKPQSAKRPTNVCGIKKCKTPVTIMGVNCPDCGYRTCFEHRTHHAAQCQKQVERLENERKQSQQKLREQDEIISRRIHEFCASAKTILDDAKRQNEETARIPYDESWQLRALRRTVQYYESNTKRLGEYLEQKKKDLGGLKEQYNTMKSGLADNEEFKQYMSGQKSYVDLVDTLGRITKIPSSQQFIPALKQKISAMEEQLKKKYLEQYENKINALNREINNYEKDHSLSSNTHFDKKIELEALTTVELREFQKKVEIAKKTVDAINNSYDIFNEMKKKLERADGNLVILNAQHRMDLITQMSIKLDASVNSIIKPYISQI